MSFGRAADNDVVLVAEEVSRHHSKLVMRGRQVVVMDLKSLNGTFVNRQRIVERVLSDRDEIWFGGKCRIVYHDDADIETSRLSGVDKGSGIQRDLDRIRAKMDRAANHLTMMGTRVGDNDKAPAPAASAEELLDMSRAYRRLEALFRVSKHIASEFDLDKRLAAVLDTVMEVLEAERGFVVLRKDDSDEIRVTVARGMGQELESGAPSMGIARRAAIDGEPVLMVDAASDEQFGTRESIIVQNIITAMCVPMRIEDRILGSCYVDARRRGFAFDEADLELFASLASQSAMAIDNVRLYEQMLAAERKRANLGRFLSPAIVDEIIKEDSILELGGRKRTATTVFCDIRGFTPMTERMVPTELVDLLNEHFTATTEIIFGHQGTLDKYIGDEVMAVFGSPLSADDDAQRAVHSALALQAKNAELNVKRELEGRPILKLGIGIDTGEVIAGYIGSPMRMEFTVIGDHVNTARRLCSIAEADQVVISAATYVHVKDVVDADDIGTVTLKGKLIPVEAFSVRSKTVDFDTQATVFE
jgi:adenylate cyclase